MENVGVIAKRLSISQNELISFGVKSYLENQLKAVEIEIYNITKEYGIKDIHEFMNKIDKGDISEEIGYEDFFKLDNLTYQRDVFLKSINDVSCLSTKY